MRVERPASVTLRAERALLNALAAWAETAASPAETSVLVTAPAAAAERVETRTSSALTALLTTDTALLTVFTLVSTEVTAALTADARLLRAASATETALERADSPWLRTLIALAIE